jgi:hypothetical protein
MCVCVCVCVCVCLSVTRFQDHSRICSRLIESDEFYCVRSRRISLSLVIHLVCAFFSLAPSNIECYDSLDFIASLFLENTVLKPQSISCLIVDSISMCERCFIVFIFD